MRLLWSTVIIFSQASAIASQEIQPYAEIVPEYANAFDALSRDPEESAAILTRLLSDPKALSSIPEEGLRYVLGRALEAAGRLQEAVAQYERIDRTVLADAALFRQGMIRLRTGDIAGARMTFAQISPASPDWVESRLALVEALLKEARPELAIAAARELVSSDLSQSNLFRARIALAQCLRALGKDDRALAVAISAWLSAYDLRSENDAVSVLNSLNAAVGPVERIVRQLARFDPIEIARLRRMRPKEPGLYEAIVGVYLLVVRKNPSGAATSLMHARANAQNPLLRAFAGYALGSALATSGDDANAMMVFEEVSKETTPFSTAAGIAAARCAMRLKKHEVAIRTLKRIERDGYEAVSRWELALAHLVAKQPEKALPYLDSQLKRVDRGRGVLFGEAEKLRYFRGVALFDQGKKDEAILEWKRVALSFPYTYYSVLAATRLTNLSELDLSFEQESSWDATKGPLLLIRLGFRTEGIETLKSVIGLGLVDQERLAALATIMAQSRRKWREYLRGNPEPTNQHLYEAAYPRPYEREVLSVSTETGVDPALIWSVMWVESAFNPRARSPLGAVGLMQLMPSTAKLIASKVLGNPKVAKRLYRPETNIFIGATYLAELERHFRGHLPLVLVGYNAGPGIARRFYKRLKDLPTDLFIEVIPYGGTATYVKKVIGFVSAYRSLYDTGRGPLLIQTSLPDSLGPFMQKRQMAYDERRAFAGL